MTREEEILNKQLLIQKQKRIFLNMMTVGMLVMIKNLSNKHLKRVLNGLRRYSKRS